MTPEEKQKLDEVYNFIQMLKASNSLPLDFDRAIQGRGYLKAIAPPVDLIVPARGSNTYYVATISGGTVDHAVVFKDGILKTA